MGGVKLHTWGGSKHWKVHLLRRCYVLLAVFHDANSMYVCSCDGLIFWVVVVYKGQTPAIVTCALKVWDSRCSVAAGEWNMQMYW